MEPMPESPRLVASPTIISVSRAAASGPRVSQMPSYVALNRVADPSTARSAPAAPTALVAGRAHSRAPGTTVPNEGSGVTGVSASARLATSGPTPPWQARRVAAPPRQHEQRPRPTRPLASHPAVGLAAPATLGLEGLASLPSMSMGGQLGIELTGRPPAAAAFAAASGGGMSGGQGAGCLQPLAPARRQHRAPGQRTVAPHPLPLPRPLPAGLHHHHQQQQPPPAELQQHQPPPLVQPAPQQPSARVLAPLLRVATASAADSNGGGEAGLAALLAGRQDESESSSSSSGRSMDVATASSASASALGAMRAGGSGTPGISNSGAPSGGLVARLGQRLREGGFGGGNGGSGGAGSGAYEPAGSSGRWRGLLDQARRLREGGGAEAFGAGPAVALLESRPGAFSSDGSGSGTISDGGDSGSGSGGVTARGDASDTGIMLEAAASDGLSEGLQGDEEEDDWELSVAIARSLMDQAGGASASAHAAAPARLAESPAGAGSAPQLPAPLVAPVLTGPPWQGSPAGAAGAPEPPSPLALPPPIVRLPLRLGPALASSGDGSGSPAAGGARRRRPGAFSSSGSSAGGVGGLAGVLPVGADRGVAGQVRPLPEGLLRMLQLPSSGSSSSSGGSGGSGGVSGGGAAGTTAAAAAPWIMPLADSLPGGPLFPPATGGGSGGGTPRWGPGPGSRLRPEPGAAGDGLSSLLASLSGLGGPQPHALMASPLVFPLAAGAAGAGPGPTGGLGLAARAAAAAAEAEAGRQQQEDRGGRSMRDLVGMLQRRIQRLQALAADNDAAFMSYEQVGAADAGVVSPPPPPPPLAGESERGMNGTRQPRGPSSSPLPATSCALACRLRPLRTPARLRSPLQLARPSVLPPSRWWL
jgi:hypothetical protein